MAGNGISSYSNREWRESMWDLIHTGMGTMLGGALRHMHGDLVSVGAGPDQVEFSNRCQTLIAELAARGARILGDWQPKAVVMGGGVAAAGDAAARDKEYHQN